MNWVQWAVAGIEAIVEIVKALNLGAADLETVVGRAKAAIESIDLELARQREADKKAVSGVGP